MKGDKHEVEFGEGAICDSVCRRCNGLRDLAVESGRVSLETRYTHKKSISRQSSISRRRKTLQVGADPMLIHYNIYEICQDTVCICRILIIQIFIIYFLCLKVKIWFQNKRSKLKKIIRQGHDPTPFLNGQITDGEGECGEGVSQLNIDEIRQYVKHQLISKLINAFTRKTKSKIYLKHNCREGLDIIAKVY